MPRFFFDLYDDMSSSPDAHGDDFESAAEAGEQAVAIVLDGLREGRQIRSGQRRGCRVRDADGAVVYDVSIEIRITGGL